MEVGEVMDAEGKPIPCTVFCIACADGSFWYGEIPKLKGDISFEEYSAALQYISPSRIYPEVPKDSHLTIAPENLGQQAYAKEPALLGFHPDRESNDIPVLLLAEVLVMEAIAKRPHPKIVAYYGCRVRNGRITGIVLRRHSKTLLEHLQRGGSIRVDNFMALIEDAINHLHSLGLAHNDLNPRNIMLDEGTEDPIIIDFRSC